jgi:hypothetical protein
MAVARIYTRFPDEATELAERLRARGYTIELVDPGDFRVTPADIEIQLDRLKTEEAMAAAARFARTHDAEIFVAPGVALEEPALRAAREGAAERGNAFVEGFKKLIAPFRRAGASAHTTRAAGRQAKLEAELAREAERKRKAEQAAPEREAREREQRKKDEFWASERSLVLARQREEEARQREEQARRQEEERRRREEEARIVAEREAIVTEERRREEEIRSREEAERRQHAEAAARLAAEEAERRRIAEEQARERQAEMAARVAEQQRLAEQERKAEEEKERERRAAAEAAALAEAKKREEETRAARVATAAPAAAAAPAVASRQPVIARLQQERQRQNARVMKRATIAAAIVAGALALGWGAYENRTPAHPLSNSDLVHGQQIKQEVPFGPASIGTQPGQAPATATTTVRPPQSQARPAQSAQNKASPAQGGKPAPHKRARQFKSAPDDVDQVAEDQVIYHGAPKHSGGQASAQQPQVKRYSDMSDGPQ